MPTRMNATTSAADRRRAKQILDALRREHPEATCALNHNNAFELLVATILSAQCTDERVNRVTPDLFRRFANATALAQASVEALEALIQSTGFYRAKARSLLGCSQALVARHGGEVPSAMEALVALPGVGRKTANVVLSHGFGKAEGIVVDTHVLRVANRLGMARGDSPDEVEAQLCAILPRGDWLHAADFLIFHGRKLCHARSPACGSCPVFDLCRWVDKRLWRGPGPPGGRARSPRASARRLPKR
jgi:endonuclease-3